MINEQQAIVVVPPDLSTFNREMTLANKSNQYNVLASDHIDFCSCSVEAALKFNPAGRSKLIIIRTYYIVCIHIYIYTYIHQVQEFQLGSMRLDGLSAFAMLLSLASSRPGNRRKYDVPSTNGLAQSDLLFRSKRL